MAKVKITLIKSAIDRPKSQKATLSALGFTKLNQTLEKETNPAVQGMIRKVIHLLKIEN